MNQPAAPIFMLIFIGTTIIPLYYSRKPPEEISSEEISSRFFTENFFLMKAITLQLD